jgi:hypothetical protein
MIGFIYLNWFCKHEIECFKWEDNTVIPNVNKTENGHLSWRESLRMMCQVICDQYKDTNTDIGRKITAEDSWKLIDEGW